MEYHKENHWFESTPEEQQALNLETPIVMEADALEVFMKATSYVGVYRNHIESVLPATEYGQRLRTAQDETTQKMKAVEGVGDCLKAFLGF